MALDAELVIVGGGISGSCLGHFAKQHSQSVMLIDANNACVPTHAILYPQLSVAQDTYGLLRQNLYSFAQNFYMQCQTEHPNIFSPCTNLVRVSYDEKSYIRLQRIYHNTKTLKTTYLDEAALNELLGQNTERVGIQFEGLNLVRDPSALLDVLQKDITKLEAVVQSFSVKDNAFELKVAQKTNHITVNCKKLIFCPGAQITKTDWSSMTQSKALIGALTQHTQTMRNTCGRTYKTEQNLKVKNTIFCTRSYIYQLQGIGTFLGATYEKSNRDDATFDELLSEAEKPDKLLERLALSDLTNNLNSEKFSEEFIGYRAKRPSQLPMLFSHKDNFAVVAGLGSGGWVSAPQLANTLCQLMFEGSANMPENQLKLLLAS